MAENCSITIAMMTPGDMVMTKLIEYMSHWYELFQGHSIGRALLTSKKNSIRVITNLTDRSDRTRNLSDSAGIVDVRSDEELAKQADFIFSILVPSQATALAQRFAPYLTEKKNLVYVDMNAIAPQTVRAMVALFPHGNFVDGSIIGSPPKRTAEKTGIHLSGPGAQRVADLFDDVDQIEARVIGDEIGQASASKMCFAAISKGITAIGIQASVTAKAFGLEEVFFDEVKQRMPDIYKRLSTSIPSMPPKAGRWVGEMEEIAQTHEDVGLSKRLFQGAADTYRFVAEQTPLGKEILEERTQGTTLNDALQIMVDSL